MKKVVYIIIILVAVFLLFFAIFLSKKNVPLSDSERFLSEYPQASQNNVFVYKNATQVLDIMENENSIIFFGFPECIWCQTYVKYLDEVSHNLGVSKIYYCNTKKESSENYELLLSKLSGYLQYNNDGKEWLYVPTVTFYVNGKLIGINYETSKDTNNLKDPLEYWTEDKVTSLKETLSKHIQNVLNSNDLAQLEPIANLSPASDYVYDASINIDNPNLDEIKATNLPIILGCGNSNCSSCVALQANLIELKNEFLNKAFIGYVDNQTSLKFFYKQNITTHPSLIIINKDGSLYKPKNKELIEKSLDFKIISDRDKTNTYTIYEGVLDVNTLKLILDDMLN